MERSLEWLLSLYNPHDTLDKASTIPSPWYFEPRIAELENEGVFSKAWQMAGRVDQVRDKGQFFTADVAGEPIVVVRGQDGTLRGFYNVCRHHAAAVELRARGAGLRAHRGALLLQVRARAHLSGLSPRVCRPETAAG